MEENKVVHFPYDPDGPIAKGIKETMGIGAGPQQSTIPNMIDATVDPASQPKLIGVDVGVGPDQTAMQSIPIHRRKPAVARIDDPGYAHDEDGLPVQNGYAILAHPPRNAPECNPGDVDPEEGCAEAPPDPQDLPEEPDADHTKDEGNEAGDEKEGNLQEDNESAGEQEEQKQLIDNPDDPLNGATEEQIHAMLQQVQEMVRIMESQWTASKNEYGLTDSHMKMLYKFNEDNREEMPEGLSDEEKDKWDHFNGLSKLTEQDVVEIFGEGHKIIGIEHTITLDRIRDVVNDFFSWTYAMREYRNIHDAYLQLIELEEEKNIKELEAIAAKEEDPEKRKAMEDAIKHYYYMKNLGFLEDELDEGSKKRMADAWSDEKRIGYWIKRSRDKLRRMKISGKVILEISQFEKRFLDEKYHPISNILLTYFLNCATYSKPDEKTDVNRNKVVCMVFALDAFIQNRMSEDKKQDLLKKVLAFEDQMLDYMKDMPGVKDAE